MRRVEVVGAWVLGGLWILPLAYAVWAAVHPSEYATKFALFAPLTVGNLVHAWEAAPFARYFLNTFVLVTLILAAQFLVCTPGGPMRLRGCDFGGGTRLFALVLLQLMITPDVLIVANYRALARLGLVDTILGIALPYLASAFGIFSVAASVSAGSFGVGGRGAAGGVRGGGANLAGLRAVGAADLCCLWARVSELSLEQLSLAARDYELC